MTSDVVIFVVVACHFRRKYQLCETTIKRLNEAINQYHLRFPRILSGPMPLMYFLVTGHCPYEKDSKKLDELMKEYLALQKGIKATRIITSTGFGIASEAKMVSEQIARTTIGRRKLIVISSQWYFWAAKPFWRKYARRNNLAASFVGVRNTGGWRTVVVYFAYAVTVRIFFAVGLGGVIEKIMNKLQASRSEGFQFNGCA